MEKFLHESTTNQLSEWRRRTNICPIYDQARMHISTRESNSELFAKRTQIQLETILMRNRTEPNNP
jgi:hypothetical protein